MLLAWPPRLNSNRNQVLHTNRGERTLLLQLSILDLRPSCDAHREEGSFTEVSVFVEMLDSLESKLAVKTRSQNRDFSSTYSTIYLLLLRNRHYTH